MSIRPRPARPQPNRPPARIRRSPLPLASCALLGALAGPLQAGPGLQQIVVTATRAQQSNTDLAASINAVPRADLELIAATHINEAMSRMPGTWISRGNGQEHLTAIRSPVFTGPGSCGEFYMAEDGVPLRPAGFCNVNQLMEVNSEQAERIEVMRGPGSALHGGNALHGVIDVISRAPAAERSGELQLEGGPHDYARLQASYSDRFDSHAYRISVNGAHDGGYKDASGFDQQKLSYRHDAEWDGLALQSLLSVTNLNQETAGYITGRDAYKDNHRKRDNPNPESFRDNTAARWYGRFTLPAGGEDRWVVTPYLRYQEMRFLQHFQPGQPLEENGLRSAGWQSAYYHSASPTLDLVSGIDGEWTQSDLLEVQYQPVTTRSDIPLGKHYDYVVDGINGAVFSQLDWRAAERWRVNAGARYEYQRYDYDNRMRDGATREDGTPCPGGSCRFSRPADRRDEFGNLSFNAGLIHYLTGSQELVLNLSHGFRPPQAAELYRLQQAQRSADLDAEEMDNIELGWRGDWQQLSYQWVVYAMRKENVIVQDADRRNIGDSETEHQGLEYSLRWQISDSWDLRGDGTWARHRYRNNVRLSGLQAGATIDGNDMVAAPRRFGSVRLGWQPTSDLRWELEWLYLGPYYLEATNQAKYEGHDLLNLRMRHQIDKRWHWAARLTNLTDRDYAERADYAFGEYRYFVGEPRALYLEVGVEF